MDRSNHADTTPQGRAQWIVKFWRRREWLTGASPIHIHPLDLDKLEQLIAAELEKQD